MRKSLLHYPTRSLLIAGLFLCVIGPSLAQNCAIDYVSRQFGVQVAKDIVYGSDTLYNGGIDSLRMNIFKPIGDDQTERPVFIAVHGGDWIGGHRNELDSLCYWYAQRGYVAATISYRLGFYGPWPLQAPFANDPPEVVRACFRAVQDLNGAIRYLKGRSMQDSSSTTQVYLWGASAGAITSMHAAYLTDESERPAACGALGPVYEFLTPHPRPDLGPVRGKLHLNGYDSSVKGVASIFGAIIDTNLIASVNDPALYLYHQSGDLVVGCWHQQGLWGLPLGVGANYPWLHGSCSIDLRMQHLGFDSSQYQFYLHQGIDHGIHNIALMDSLVAVFFANQVCPPTSTGTPDQASLNDTFLVKISPNPADQNLNISWEGLPINRLRFFDLSGRLVTEMAVSHEQASSIQMPVGELPNGLYFLQYEIQGKFYAQRIVVAH